MQRELQITLTIIGILVIGGVLLHGIWTSRKNAQKIKKARFEPSSWDHNLDQASDGIDDDSLFDDVGVGKARQVAGADHPNNIGAKDRQSNANDAAFKARDELSDKDSTHHSDDGSSISNYAKYVKEEEQLNDVSRVFEDEPAQIHVDSIAPTLDDEGVNTPGRNELYPQKTAAEQEQQSKSDNNASPQVKPSDSPLYSNVVTQPKPEFTKAGVAKSDASFGQPPEFLLKTSMGELEGNPQNSEQGEVLNSDTNNQVFTENALSPAEEDVDLTPLSNGISESNTRPNIDTNETLTRPPIKVDRSQFQPSETPSDFALDVQSGLEPTHQEPRQQEMSNPSQDKQFSFTEQAKRFVRRNKKTVAEKIRKEPLPQGKTAQDQMRMDFTDEHRNDSALLQGEPAHSDTQQQEGSTNADAANNKRSGHTDVLVLNIRASEDNPISGASLLPMLLTLGFKFGEHDIFHRHVSTNGKGPILFSLTNMFKPGVFDIDNIENFSTHGLSLFMMLPIEGEPQQVFNMMHNAARKLSEEFSCRILDGNKVALSKQSLQQYVERIREFERSRLGKHN